MRRKDRGESREDMTEVSTFASEETEIQTSLPNLMVGRLVSIGTRGER